MTALAFVVLAVYTLSLLYITVYCLLQFNLLYHYKLSPNPTHRPEPPDPFAPPIAIGAPPEKPSLLPFVTVQLPIYNEYYVIERLIDAVAAFDYPMDRFEIHVLDDSTDETVELVRRKVEEYRARGYQDPADHPARPAGVQSRSAT